MLISTLNCKMWPNFSYRGVRSVQLLLLLLLLMVFSSENFGFSPPYAGIAGIGPGLNSEQPSERLGICTRPRAGDLLKSLSVFHVEVLSPDLDLATKI